MPFVPTHDHLQEILGRGVREFSHAEIVDDQERHRCEIGEKVLPRAVERRVGEFLEQDVGFAIVDAVALLK